MSQNFPFSIPTGINLVPRGPGSSLGSASSPFEFIYVNNIVSSGGAGEYVNVTGDTMTGDLTMSGSTSIIMNPVIVGTGNVNSGTWSVMVGKTNTIHAGLQATTVGGLNIASGLVATSVGYGNQAIGNFSSAMGTQNVTNGADTSAFGRQNQANADGASAFGYGNIANGTGTQVFGKGVTGTLDETLYLGAPSGVVVVYDNVDNSSSARIIISDLSSNANSKLEMTGNAIRLSYDEGVSDGFGSIEFNGDGITTIIGGKNAGYSQIELNPGGFSFLSPGGLGTEANFSGSNGVIGFNTSSFVGAKNASLNINAGESVVLDFNDSVTPFTGSIAISSTGVILSGISIFPYSGNTQTIGDFQPFTSTNIPFQKIATSQTYTDNVTAMNSLTISSAPALSSAIGDTDYNQGSIYSHAANASNLNQQNLEIDANSDFWKIGGFSNAGASFISGNSVYALFSVASSFNGNSSIALSPNTITLNASGPGTAALLPTSSGTMNIGSSDYPFSGVFAFPIMKSPDGSLWRLTIDNAGVVSGVSYP